MNRPIKFRGKRVDGKGWEHGSLVILRGRYFIIPNESGCFRKSPHVPYRYEVIPGTIGQFAGRHDEKSHDIYEGDRVLLSIPGNPDSEHEVIFENGSFALRGDKGNLSLSRVDGKEYRILRITGNIHDNTDLLNSQ
jgi:hypothetical protein